MVNHQLQVERRTGKVRPSETDVLPLCYATNYYSGNTYKAYVKPKFFLFPGEVWLQFEGETAESSVGGLLLEPHTP